MHRSTRLLIALAASLCAGVVQAETALERAQERAQQILSANRGGPSEVLYVGPGGAPCDHATLGAALTAAAPSAEIRLVTGSYPGPFVTGEKSLTLIGGYADCSAASRTGRSTLTGQGTATALVILSNDGTAGITLEYLDIENGSSGTLAGGLDIRGGVSVVMRAVRIRSNTTGANGGGLRVAHSDNTDGALVVMLEQTLIAQNAANSGGGVACLGNGGSPHVVVLDSGAIANNDATSFGGGVSLRNCTFVSLAGGPLEGIIGNEAGSNGGGIYASEGSQVSLDGTAPGFLTPGDPESSASLSNNAAGNSGGGIYVTGSGSLFRAIDADIAFNTAFNGAAISADGADVIVERDPETDCRRFDTPGNPAPCSRIRNNVSDQATTIGLRGDGTSSRISQTFIHGNQTNAGINSPLIKLFSEIGGNPTELELEGVVIHDNAVQFVLFETWNDADLSVLWSTIADNSLGDTQRRLFDPWVESGAVAGQRLVYGSIIDQPGVPIAGSAESQSFFFFCNIAHDLGFPGQISQSQAADPMFIDPASDNYHVKAESPAVDFCAEGSWPPQYPDMDGETRGAAVQSSSTPYDAGADEALDRIFSDRFFN